MRTLPFNTESLLEAVTLIKSGAVIAHATETCYGFACDLSNIEAVKKLFAIKNRPEAQPVSGLFSSGEEAKKYVLWNERAEELAQQYLPGPLTIILPMRSDAPSQLFPSPHSQFSRHPELAEGLHSQLVTLGVRVSSSPDAALLVTACNFPTSTTSANLHGLPNPYSAADIIKQFENQEHQPDLILDSGTLPQVPPSTVIDCTKEVLEEKRPGNLHII